MCALQRWELLSEMFLSPNETNVIFKSLIINIFALLSASKGVHIQTMCI